jgi:hypothetical protein
LNFQCKKLWNITPIHRVMSIFLYLHSSSKNSRSCFSNSHTILSKDHLTNAISMFISEDIGLSYSLNWSSLPFYPISDCDHDNAIPVYEECYLFGLFKNISSTKWFQYDHFIYRVDCHFNLV